MSEKENYVRQIRNMAAIHLKSGSADSYGQGVYNGLQVAAAILENDASLPDLTITLENYLKANKSNGMTLVPPPASGLDEKGES